MSGIETTSMPKSQWKALSPPPTVQQHVRAAMAWDKQEVDNLFRVLADSGRLALFLLPVLVPGLAAFVWRDNLIRLVDAHPESGWASIAVSLAIIWVQLRILLRSGVVRAWNRMLARGRELFDYLVLNRFGVVFFAAQAAIFLFVPQGVETLRTLFEHRHFNVDALYRGGFFWFSLILLALSQWYTSRELLRTHRSHLPGKSPLYINLPQLLGIGVFLIMALALHNASYAYLNESAAWKIMLGPLPLGLVLLAGPRLMPVTLAVLTLFYAGLYAVNGCLLSGHPAFSSPWHSLNRAALACMACACIMSWALSVRRQWLEYHGISDGISPEAPQARPARDWQLRHPALRTFDRCLGPGHYFFSAALFFGLVLIMILFPLVPKTLGSASLFLFAAGTFTRIGATLSDVAELKRIPIFSLLLGGLVAFGLINDNHPVRQLTDLPPAKPLATNLHQFAAQWLDHAMDRCPEAAAGELPVFLVAAEGGGVRAAYWTASVLSGLQDRHPCFAGRLMAFSGVSGGSVGGAVFAAQVAQRKAEGSTSDGNHSCRDFDQEYRTGYLACSRAILGDDFLAPALGTLLYPDLLQRFLPFPVSFFDRATALEKGFERSYRRAMKQNLFAAPFDTLWRMTADPGEVPTLFLNGTWVENGWRIIASPVLSDSSERAAAKDLDRFVDHPVRVSTAAHLSARFTYVSPAGTLHREGRINGHVVDGGYFENSGTATLGEILDALRDTLEATQYQWTDARQRTFRVTPHVAIIRFEEKPAKGRLVFADLIAPRPQAALVETSSPLTTLLQTRAARGEQSVRAMFAQVQRMRLRQPSESQSQWITFTLRDQGGPLPLGWSLSSAAKEEIHHQLMRVLDSSSVTGQISALLP
jgi:hypothetical protein